jgi:hypothetical protein
MSVVFEIRSRQSGDDLPLASGLFIDVHFVKIATAVDAINCSFWASRRLTTDKLSFSLREAWWRSLNDPT